MYFVRTEYFTLRQPRSVAVHPRVFQSRPTTVIQSGTRLFYFVGRDCCQRCETRLKKRTKHVFPWIVGLGAAALDLYPTLLDIVGVGQQHSEEDAGS